MSRSVEDPLPTRWSLIQRLKNPEDQEGWNAFFEMYQGLIFGVAMRAGLGEPEAREVVQDTLVSVHQNIGQFEADPALGSFKCWLLRLTQWRIADQFRRRPRAEPPAQGQPADATSRTSTVERIPDPHCDLEAIWETEWKQNLLSLALKLIRTKVDPEQFQIFDFYALRNWPLIKVTRVLGVNAGQVYLAKHRISKMLKHEVERLTREMT
jgi:RNA polymerase sigma-70 factor (ECF subfamily)